METKSNLTKRIIKCCFEVHNKLGPGFNEKVYQEALKISLKESGLHCEEEKEFSIFFKDSTVGTLKVDLIIENHVIVELKSVAGKLPEVFKSQLLSYLKVSKLRIGLLVNFGNNSCQIKRLIF